MLYFSFIIQTVLFWPCFLISISYDGHLWHREWLLKKTVNKFKFRSKFYNVQAVLAESTCRCLLNNPGVSVQLQQKLYMNELHHSQ